MQIADAVFLARRLHRGQVDKVGAPYNLHLERVAHRLIELFPDVTEEEIIGALLHDAIEDGHASATGLLNHGVPAASVAMVTLLTKPVGMHYIDWIRDTVIGSQNRGAMRIKLADALDNADPRRPPHAARARMLVNKYFPAITMLTAALGIDRDKVLGQPFPLIDFREG